MKTYSVNFSFYSEQYGDFEETTIKVDADNQFEARRLAWERAETSDDLQFASNIKVCGITWDASPLDMQDYFNAEAAYEKYRLKYLENVDIPNAQIANNAKSLDYYERQKYEHYGCLQTIFRIAEGLGRSHGMLPPTAYEELHYAREFLTLLEGCDDFDKYNAFLKKIERAEKWDSASLYDIRDSFKYGYFTANGIELDFSKQYDKNGIYPDRADLTDGNYKYLSRWSSAREYKAMNRLPFFDEKNIITDSHTMQYDWQTLVMKREVLRPDFQIPVNSIWIANQGSAANFDRSGDRPLVAENPFTGKILECKRSDFLGVLRPEIAAKIDYEAIKNEWQEAKKTEQHTDHGIGAENDEDMEQ